ncbi:MAG: hypothetical protein BZY80_01545 [SAR202 cluster bacterium Io17-Chloro-G2]|nr:MAG: hypothetical protein BZY80_01545 [SAR202 cluster bacterium Io17-Chloro-G2]
MPRYDYKCTNCEQEFELVQTFSEAGSGVCPLCSGKGQRVYHAVPVIYKGSGFYTTDYGRPKPPSENGSKETKDSKDSKTTGDNKESSSSSTSDSKEKVSASDSGSSGSSSSSADSGSSGSSS